jgi:hypothetical protein
MSDLIWRSGGLFVTTVQAGHSVQVPVAGSKANIFKGDRHVYTLHGLPSEPNSRHCAQIVALLDEVGGVVCACLKYGVVASPPDPLVASGETREQEIELGESTARL